MSRKANLRDLVAFWVFGFSNNYAYVIMLSAAIDIISPPGSQIMSNSTASTSVCQEKIVQRECNELSTGAVLIADILPCLIIKILAPFFMHRLPFGFRHFLVCTTQAFGFVIVAYAPNINYALLGIALASISSGFGESCYLALAANYPKSAISLWSSGTGGAGVAGSFAYAALTEPKLGGLRPREALLAMLIVPAIFAIAYWIILTESPSVYRADIFDPKTWIVPDQKCLISSSKEAESDDVYKKSSPPNFGASTQIEKGDLTRKSTEVDSSASNRSQIYWIMPLLRYMIPLSIVYFSEYLINQGIVELFVFDCAHGFSMAQPSQYRWYQVFYQIGVFISRSSVNFIELSAMSLYLLPVLQTLNLGIFFFNALYPFIPHIALVFVFILFEGFFGGASYVNTFNRIYKEVPSEVREFCLSVATLSDSIGTVLAGFAAIPLHNYICSLTMQ